MSSNFGKPTLNNYEFDFGGLSTNRPRSMNDQKHQHRPSSYSQSSSSSSFSSTQTRPATTPSWQPNKPSWTHQPAAGNAARPGLSGAPASMVGDILGKSWSSGASTGIGIADKNPNLFGDLLGSALGQGKSNNSNVPLKNISSKSSYSMENLADSLPKTSNPVKSNSNWGSGESFGSYTGPYNKSNINNNNFNKGPNLGGPSMRNLGGVGAGMSANKDPFGSLVDFGSKQTGNLNTARKSNEVSTGNDAFGDFQNASKSSTSAYPSNAHSTSNSTNNNNFMGSSPASGATIDDFGIPSKDYSSQNQPPAQPAGVDPIDMLFTSSSSSAGAASAAAQGLGNQQFSEADDWGLDTEFGGGGGNETGTTTELEGLPPPPAGVSASSAMNKGVDNYKQGQYADAIKWLSWAVILLEKAGNNASTMEVLSCRASCYKEVGEYKKAVADCTKVLEHDDTNVSVLVQRALLYESIEKYKLGAEDLRSVMKLDPGNRVARSTIHRLTKMAG
ncbi:uncharacterized protein LOC131150869 [Malania oleifera]|uniref:uncharacterized protein LOC131150869 n=1 Tax=Malania oleifera TaxID=397392 RepID=UPI0025AEA4EE|nr:uncharacterized protein LOC131150869 [Malania oleifera]XP_057957895.1 uncharacterized protein LOC131150869 [Malania oleifera]